MAKAQIRNTNSERLIIGVLPGWEEVAARSIGTLWSECQTRRGGELLVVFGRSVDSPKSGWRSRISTTQLKVNPLQVGELPHAAEAHCQQS
jgi:hypothetical protein